MPPAKRTEDKSATKVDFVTPDEVRELESARDPRACVVDDGTGHTGRAVNGLVCSRHANRYRADGTPR